jgi:hypothetical protein
MKQLVSPNFNGIAFNPEPEATAVSTRDCRPTTAGASGFGLNKEAVGVCESAKHSRLPDSGLGFKETAIERSGTLSNGGPSNL